jgi:N-acetylmuramoyl-L-alanine amidase
MHSKVEERPLKRREGSLRISNHLLTDGPVTQLSNLVSPVIVPELIVIHFGVTHSLSSLVAVQKARGYWAHLSIDGSTDEQGAVYAVTQALPFNMRGSHAGPSKYKGREAVNHFSVGIEIANPGPLTRAPDGTLRTVYGKPWPEEDALEARHDHPGAPPNWTHWAQFSDQEIDLCVEICHLLRTTYPTITDVVGHDEVSRGRKFDPGPAFPMEWLRKKVFSTS